MVVGRPCAVLYKGQWIQGTIIRHDVKNNKCTVETKLGTVKIHDHRIRMTDKPVWEC
jgi:hypothetical protein